MPAAAQNPFTTAPYGQNISTAPKMPALPNTGSIFGNITQGIGNFFNNTVKPFVGGAIAYGLDPNSKAGYPTSINKGFASAFNLPTVVPPSPAAPTTPLASTTASKSPDYSNPQNNQLSQHILADQSSPLKTTTDGQVVNAKTGGVVSGSPSYTVGADGNYHFPDGSVTDKNFNLISGPGSNTGGNGDNVGKNASSGSNGSTGGSNVQVAGSQQQIQPLPDVGTTGAPAIPQNPYDSPEYQAALSAYQTGSTPTTAEEQALQQEANLKESLGITEADLQANPQGSDQPFLTGEGAAIQNRITPQITALEDTASRLQAQRLAQQQGAAGVLSSLQAKYNSPYMSPTVLNQGQTLVQPGTGNVLGVGQTPSGVFQPYTNPMTGEVGTINTQTGQFSPVAGGTASNFGTGTGGGNAPAIQMPANVNSQTSAAVQQLPPTMQSSVSFDSQGQGFVVLSRVPQALQGVAASLANKAGLPAFNDQQATAVGKIDTTLSNFDIIRQLAQKNLSNLPAGIGRGINTFNDLLNNVLQTNPDLTALGSFRETALANIQALASDASGLRMSQAELNMAAANLPLPTDSLDTAMAKLDRATQILNNQRANLYNLGGLGNASQGQAGGNSADPYAGI